MSLRLISGALKNRRLKTLRGPLIRPTSDRLRETIFNILHAYPPPQTVLDLFAGSGALALEALSRGSQRAVLVDHQAAACAVMAQNIRHCGLDTQATVIRWNIRRNLRCLERIPFHYDLAFMDPPYNQNLVAAALAHLHRSGRLTLGATLVVEHHQNEPVGFNPMHFGLLDQRRYGKTLVSFLKYMV